MRLDMVNLQTIRRTAFNALSAITVINSQPKRHADMASARIDTFVVNLFRCVFGSAHVVNQLGVGDFEQYVGVTWRARLTPASQIHSAQFVLDMNAPESADGCAKHLDGFGLIVGFVSDAERVSPF